MKTSPVKRKARTPQLSKKNKEMVRLYATNPDMSKTEAYKLTHEVAPTTKLTSVYQQAAHTFKNPLVKTELDKYNDMIENTLVNTVQDWGTEENASKRGIAIDTAKYIHDKIHGKATQRVEQHTTGVTLTIDLTSSLSD